MYLESGFCLLGPSYILSVLSSGPLLTFFYLLFNRPEDHVDINDYNGFFLTIEEMRQETSSFTFPPTPCYLSSHPGHVVAPTLPAAGADSGMPAAQAGGGA